MRTKKEQKSMADATEKPAEIATEKPRTLAGKLAHILGEIERIEKRGYNDFHKYKYAMEADITDAVRKLLSAQRVFIFSELEAQTQRDAFVIVEGKQLPSKNGPVTTVTMRYTFVDGDTGEERSIRWEGTGQDNGDKGLYKAMTGAGKYFLMKTFLIPTGDDPEREDNRQQEMQRGASKPKTAPRPATTQSAAENAATGQPDTKEPAPKPSAGISPKRVMLDMLQAVYNGNEANMREGLFRITAAVLFPGDETGAGFRKLNDMKPAEAQQVLEAIASGKAIWPTPEEMLNSR